MSILDHVAKFGKNVPIKRKLLFIVLATTNAALLLASLAVIVFDRQSAKATMQQEINVLARVIAHRSTAALTFGDSQLASENLETLSEKPSIVAACIYAENDLLFAEYINQSGKSQSCNKDSQIYQKGFHGDYYIDQHEIKLDQIDIGRIVIKASLSDINERLLRYISVVIVIFIGASILAFILAIKLQRLLTQPIEELSEASRAISKGRGYAVRVKQTTNDEVGELVAAFNMMLSGIEERDAALVIAKDNLEEIVKERTKALREAQSELVRSERMATLGQLTATVSHELRNPLGTIRTSVFTLSNRIKDRDQKLKKNIERIERNIIRCDNIITELLDYSRIRALQHEKTNLSAWITNILGDIKIPDSISIKLDLDDNIDIEIDRDLLRRVIINVVDNAYQAIDESPGEIDDKTIIIKCGLINSRTEIIVIDTGMGISDDVLPHIFEPLYSTKGFGVGLGLPVVKHIMEQHGGGVEVTTEKGVGTRVVLWLPSSLNFGNQIAS